MACIVALRYFNIYVPALPDKMHARQVMCKRSLGASEQQIVYNQVVKVRVNDLYACILCVGVRAVCSRILEPHATLTRMTCVSNLVKGRS